MEARLQSQDEKIAALKDNMERLAKTQEQTSTQVHQLEVAQQQQGQQFQESFARMQTEVDASLQKSLKAHSTQMDSRFDQLLKAMQNHKRPRGKEEDDDMSG